MIAANSLEPSPFTVAPIPTLILLQEKVARKDILSGEPPHLLKITPRHQNLDVVSYRTNRGPPHTSTRYSPTRVRDNGPTKSETRRIFACDWFPATASQHTQENRQK